MSRTRQHSVTGGTVTHDLDSDSLSVALRLGNDGLRLELSHKAAATAVGLAVSAESERSQLEDVVSKSPGRGGSSFSASMLYGAQLKSKPTLEAIKRVALFVCGVAEGSDLTGTRSDFGACSVFVAVARIADYDRESVREFLGRKSPSAVTNAERRAVRMKESVKKCIEILSGNRACPELREIPPSERGPKMATTTTKKSTNKVAPAAKKTTKKVAVKAAAKTVTKVTVKAAVPAVKKAAKCASVCAA